MLLIVEEIIAAASVDFEEGNVESDLLRFVVRMHGEFEHVGDELILDSAHGEGFSGSGLPVREARDDSVGEDVFEEWAERVLVDVGGGFCFCERIVEVEVVVFDVFRDAVNAEFRREHAHLRVRNGHGVDFSVDFFFLEDGPLSNAHAEL